MTRPWCVALRRAAIIVDARALPLTLPRSSWPSTLLDSAALPFASLTPPTHPQGLCIADSLLARGFSLDPLDLLLRFTAWWNCGYNNAFRYDAQRAGGRSSVGLGGTIGQALSDFPRSGLAATRTGNGASSGNGVLMRLAAVPCCFHGDEAAATSAARTQARTTHAGDEASEAAALMAAVIVRAIHAPGADADARKAALWDSLASWETPVASVRALARAEAEPGPGGAPDPDRDWRWRGPARLDYSPTRATTQPGYIGSYCMDALAMALFCVASTHSFRDAVLAAANLRGDADTVAAIAGQIAGAIYGESAIPRDWVAAVERWDGGGSIARRAHCLFAKEAAVPPLAAAAAEDDKPHGASGE